MPAQSHASCTRSAVASTILAMCAFTSGSAARSEQRPAERVMNGRLRQRGLPGKKTPKKRKKRKSSVELWDSEREPGIVGRSGSSPRSNTLTAPPPAGHSG